MIPALSPRVNRPAGDDVADGDSLDHTGWEGNDTQFLEIVESGEPPELNTVKYDLTVG